MHNPLLLLLYYWRGDNYRRDLDLGAGYHLNQGSPRLHDLDLGDSLWAFTRLENGRYVEPVIRRLSESEAWQSRVWWAGLASLRRTAERRLLPNRAAMGWSGSGIISPRRL